MVRRPAVREDLASIWRYIARDDPLRASAFLRAIEVRIQTLADNPRMGPARFRHFPALRYFSFENYLIIYRPLDDRDGIELVRVLHGARDIERLLSDQS